MQPSSIHSTIQINARQKNLFPSGDFVLIRVIKKLAPGKWAVAYKGRVYSAKSELELGINQLIRVKVARQGKTFLLKISESSPEPSLLSEKLGLADTSENRILLTLLVENKLPLSHNLIDRIKKLGQSKKELFKIIIRLLKKKIPPEGIDLWEIYELLEGPGSGDEGSFSDEEDPPDWKEVKKMFDHLFSRDGGEEKSLLALMNHLKEEHESWIVLPLKFRIGSRVWKGRVRFLVVNCDKTIRRSIISLSGDTRWSFLIDHAKKAPEMMVFSSSRVYIGNKSKLLDSFSLKLEQIGIYVHPEIYDYTLIDDFDSSGEMIKNIDQWG